MTPLESLRRRAVRLDRLIDTALSCASLRDLEQVTTGKAGLIPCHLRELRAETSSLTAELGSIVALARAADAWTAAKDAA